MHVLLIERFTQAAGVSIRLDFDAEGRLYYNSLKVVGSVYTCDLFKSWDGGATWGPAQFAWGGDKQWMTIDRTGGIGHGHIYQSWSIFGSCCVDSTFNRSTDGGQIFSQPIPNTISDPPIWGTLAVSSDGTLYIAGANYGGGGFLVSRSSDAKNPAVATTIDSTTSVNLGGNIQFGQGLASPNPDGLLGQAWIAVDNSGTASDGYLYLLCSVNPPGPDPLDVYFSRSINSGVSWSTPLRVNDDISNSNWQWFGTMSVAPNGRIDVIWNDTRNTGLHNESELFYAFSTDNGLSFSTNQQVSPTFDSHLGWPNQNKLGDYYDMISDDVGAHVAWAATF